VADYTVRIIADTEEADKKVKKLDREVTQVTEDRKLNIAFPSFDDVIRNIQTLGRVLKQTWEIAGKLPLLGGRIQDIQDVGDITLATLGKIKNALLAIPKLTPGGILQGAFTGAVRGADELAKRVANLGFVIFGVTQSIGVLKGAFGSFFNDTIGREIRLQESLLRTKTTLASTADVAVSGKRITDPLEAIVKLEKPIEETLQNIRVRSLEIAGTTSDAIVQVFGVVASQIGNIGGGLKEAEDLAITFSAALGTLGLSDPFYATQEIRSILTGTIDQNSILARSLGLTNEEVVKAKNSAEGLVEFLKRRLGSFTAGQSLAAKGFAGITSNIQEFAEEVKRSFGKGMLDPLLEGLTVLYQRLQLIFKPALGIADALGRAAGALGKGVIGAAAAAPTLQGITQRTQKQTFDKGEQYSVDAFVKTQQYIDNLRPAIAGLVDQITKAVAQLASGLKVLAEGFVTFKAEQVKIYMDAFTRLASTLNSTVVPAFTQLMKVYGDLLKLPVIQWLNAAAIDFGLLERVGIMPLVRTLFTLTKSFGGAFSLLKQVGEGAQWLTRQIAGLATAFIVLLSKAVEAASTALRNLGQGLVWLATQGITGLLGMLRALAVQIQVLLVQLAEFAAAAGPRLAALAPAIADVAKAFGSIDRALGQAQQGVGEFALKAAAALDKVEIAAKQVQAGIEGVGQKITGALDKAGKGIQGMIGGWVKGMALFFAEMLVVQLLILGIYELVTKIQMKNQEISDQTKAELAVKRLSTVYAELGENASAAAKAMREIQESIVTTRIDALKKSLGELTEKMEEQQKIIQGNRKGDLGSFVRTVGAGMNPMNIFDNKLQIRADEIGMQKGNQRNSGFTNLLLAAQERDANQFKAKAKELQRLASFQQKFNADAKADEDVRILAKERFALEKELKDLRKEINKELSDLEWNEKQKVLQLEQQMREALFQKERSEMEERHRQENQNLGTIGQQYASILDEYEKGIFDAQVNSQKRQFDFATRQAELEKQVSDYRYRLEQQTLKLREKMGDMSKKITDYESAEKIRTAKEVLNYALKAAAKQNEDFAVTPDEIRDFNNAAAKAGVSATKVLTMLKLGSGRQFGISSATSPEQIMETMKANFPILNADDSTFVARMNDVSKAYSRQATGGTFAYQQAFDELNNRRFLKSAPPTPPPKMGDLSQYLSVDRESARMGSALTQTLNKSQEFLRLQNELDMAKPLQDLRKQLDNPSFWQIQSIGELDEQLKKSADNLNLLNKALDKGQLPGQLEIMQNNMKTLLDIVYGSAQEKAISRIQKSGLTPESKQKTIDQTNKYFDFIRQVDPSEALKELTQAGPDQIWQSLRETLVYYQKFFAQLPQIASRLTTLSAEAVKAAIAEARKQATDARPQIAEAFGQFTDLLKSMIPGGYSLGKANMRSGLDAQQFITNQLMSADPSVLQDPAQVADIYAQGEKLRLQYEAVNTALDPMRTSLENFRSRVELAASATAVFTDAHRAFADEMLSGSQDMSTAIQGFGEAISKNFVSKFLDLALQPMEEQMFSLFKRIFGVEDAERTAREALLQSQTRVVNAINANTLVVDANTRAQMGTPTPTHNGQGGPDISAHGPQINGWKIGAQVGPALAKPTSTPQPGPIALPTIPYTGESTSVGATSEEALNKAREYAAEQFTAQGKAAAETVPKTSIWGTALQGATQALAGISMGIGGAQQMGKGGTYNTLMGLAGIFGALGSITGMFGTGGIFAGKKASGGPVKANRPYLVGEIGPELFLPNSDGEVVSNAKSRKLMSAAALAGKSQTFSANAGARQQATPSKVRFDFTYQSEVINNTEYVTADQFQKGMIQSAERGRALALSSLQNSVRDRRRIGMA
jgi:hypothetical protein